MYPGWISGLAGPLTTGLKRVDMPDGTFSVEVRGDQCTNDFACSPGPSFTSMTSVTFDGFKLLQRKLDTNYKVCWCGGDCALGEYWHTVPGFLEVPAAALVWTAESPFAYG